MWCLYGRDGANTSDSTVVVMEDADCQSLTMLIQSAEAKEVELRKQFDVSRAVIALSVSLIFVCFVPMLLARCKIEEALTVYFYLSTMPVLL